MPSYSYISLPIYLLYIYLYFSHLKYRTSLVSLRYSLFDAIVSIPGGHRCVIVLTCLLIVLSGVAIYGPTWSPALMLFTFICSIISASPDHGNAPSANLINYQFIVKICWTVKLEFKVFFVKTHYFILLEFSTLLI